MRPSKSLHVGSKNLAEINKIVAAKLSTNKTNFILLPNSEWNFNLKKILLNYFIGTVVNRLYIHLKGKKNTIALTIIFVNTSTLLRDHKNVRSDGRFDACKFRGETIFSCLIKLIKSSILNIYFYALKLRNYK